MCGLVGVVNKWQSGFSKPQQEIFNTLLFLDYLRGNDSTGVFAVHNNGDIALAKEASNPIKFMDTKEYEDIMQKTWSRGNALIGHNRKATRGMVNDENAHPFVVDDKIVLVHNGTMFGDHKKIADVEVDSHAIAHAIHEKGNVTEALSSFDAAYALIWYDFENRTLNFIRNNHRPLWWMETNSEYIWASEKCMLDFVQHKGNLKLKEEPTELPADLHQVFFLENNSWGSRSNKLTITKKETTGSNTVQGPWPQTQHHRHNYGSVYQDMYNFEDADADDVPFEMRATGAVNDPERQRQLPVLVQTPAAKTTPDFERELAHRMNKTVTQSEWTEKICPYYTDGKRVTAQAFDYCYANQRDRAGGYYLYCALVEDHDIIIRHYFEAKYTTEERVLQIASGEYIYNYCVGRKRWAPFSGTVTGEREQPGYVLIEGDQAVLIEGGGMVNPMGAVLQ